MTSNVTHATIRIASGDPVHPAVGEDGVYLFDGSAQLCFGHGQAAIDAIARKVAAKAFLGDLITEWKRRTGAQE
jgi:hypothetical protein